MHPRRKYSSETLRALLSIMSIAILGISLVHPGRALAQEPADQTTDAQAACLPAHRTASTLSWSPKGDSFDTGIQSFVSINASGFIVEVHSSEQFFSTGLYYHLGKLNLQNGTVQWGPSRRFSSGGSWPAVAITDAGMVILTRSDAGYNCCSNLDYWVGTVDPSGSVQQEISFRQSQVEFDRGFHDGLSINSNGTIVETHESGNDGSGLYYRLGSVDDRYQIVWATGSKGQQYDNGVDTRVAVDASANVVEVHRVTNESLLHYARGAISNNKITFDEKPRYENAGTRPSIAMRDSSFVLETEDRLSLPYYRIGTLNPNNPKRLEWGNRRPIFPRNIDWGTNTSVAVNGSWAIVTLEYSSKLYYTTARLP